MRAFASGLAVALVLAGCGGSTAGPSSRATGGACKTNSDCDHTCITNPTFPNGYCTITCANDGQCPAGAACVSDNFGNMCEVLCSTVNNNCTAFGPGFACDEKARVTGPPAAMVCRSH